MSGMNNAYNFKNPVRHFFNIEKVLFEKSKGISIKNLSWTKPIKFKVRKESNLSRTLKMPNVLNFKIAINKLKDMDNFFYIEKIDEKKRIMPNLKTGDFVSNSYTTRLEMDFQNMCIYDCLLRIDIKEFYNRIYTHNLELSTENQQYITNMNEGRTNGLLMGSYLSLYLAETLLAKISKNIFNKIAIDSSINCNFNYFSDDFYFYCNYSDVEKIKKIFSSCLDEYNLEINTSKIELWTYEQYSDYNVVEKYWKTIVSNCKLKNIPVDKRNLAKKENDELELKKFWFINQLIYRKSKLVDEKSKYIFIVNFFKSTFFHQIDEDEYELQDFNVHQILSLYKNYPEIMLYSIKKFHIFTNFKEQIKKFLVVRYSESLKNEYHEEQLYYFYALKITHNEEILSDRKNIELVINSNNQILISYYAMYKLFSIADVERIMLNKTEDKWFQNYHLILFYKKATMQKEIMLLIPDGAKKDLQKKTYESFYSENLLNDIALIKPIDEVQSAIKKYLDLKIEERAELNKDYF